MIPAHGGRLVNRIAQGEQRDQLLAKAESAPRLKLNAREVSDLEMIGIGAMMGPGIFALPGELAQLVGPLSVFVYVLMGLVTMFTALNYAELGAALPVAGGGYSMTQRTLPRPIAFLTGWIALFYIWVFLLGLPVGPGAPTEYIPTGP